METTKNIAILISGTGTNADKIMQYFHLNSKMKVSLIISHKENNWIESQCKKYGAEYLFTEYKNLNNASYLHNILSNKKTDLVVLAGYLKKIPAEFIQFYPEKIINIHPSLLPKYGGKGMYGDYVHNEVLKSKETESGITIHYVNEEFDKGKIIAQFKCIIEKNESLKSLKEKIQKLEHRHYPEIIEKVIKQT